MTQSVTELVEEVHQADIDGALKLLLIDYLQKILTALNMYRIEGSDALRDAAFATAGAMVSTSDLSERFRGPVRERFDKVMVLLFGAVAAGGGGELGAELVRRAIEAAS
ncbi:hypothetical protein [Streptodolium elevatio]